jgi:hypothetical protein
MKRLSGTQTFARMIDARTQHDIVPGASTLTVVGLIADPAFPA